MREAGKSPTDPALPYGFARRNGVILQRDGEVPVFSCRAGASVEAMIEVQRLAGPDLRPIQQGARLAGTASTGNSIRGGFAGTPNVGCLALQLEPGTRSQAELVADIDDGLLVQSVVGLHSGVNPVSGDFSTGASGMLITNGEVGAPVRELTIASTLQRMLLDVVEVGGDVDWLPMRAAGVSLVIRDVTMSGA